MFQKQSRQKLYRFLLVMILIGYSFWCENVVLHPDYHSLKYWLIKFTFLLFVIWFVNVSYNYFCINCQSWNKYKKKHLSLLFMMIISANLVVLALIYPGMWGGDELWLLPSVRDFNIGSVQHWIVAIWYIWMLMIIPCPTGIILSVILLNVSVIMLVAAVIYEKIKHKYLIFLILLPSCSFQVLLFNEYPLRCSVYASIEILLFLSLRRLFKETTRQFDFVKISFLLVLLSTLRSEGIYYMLIGAAFYLILYKKNIFTPVFLSVSIILTSFGFFGVNMLQRRLTYQNYDHNTITAVIDPITDMIRNEAEKCGGGWKENNLLQKINETMSVDIILNSESSGTALMWMYYSDFFIDGKPEIHPGFWDAYTTLMANNLDVFFKNRWQTFIKTQNNTVYTQAQISESLWSNEGISSPPTVLNLDISGFQPLNYDIFAKTLTFMTFNWENSSILKLIRIICFSLLIPFTGILFSLFKLCKEKNHYGIVVLLSVLSKIPLIWMTMPGEAFMYYYPVYYIGIFTCTIYLITELDRRYQKRIKKS